MIGPMRLSGIAMLLGALSVVPAAAQTTTVTGLANGTYSVGGWSFTLNGCAVHGMDGTGGSASCSTEEVIATATATALSLVFEGPGGAALQSLGANGTGYGDLSFVGGITVTALGSEVIWGVSASVAGSAASGLASDKQLVTANSGTITHGGIMTASGASTSLAASPILQSIVFAPSASVSSVPDFKTNKTPAGALTMASATLIYNAPEPVSLGILAIGAAGIAAVKRRPRRG